MERRHAGISADIAEAGSATSLKQGVRTMCVMGPLCRADPQRKAGRAERGAADGAWHGREHAATMAHQHAALRPTALLPRPQGASSYLLIVCVLSVDGFVL